MNKAQIFAAIEKRFSKQVSNKDLQKMYDGFIRARADLRPQVDARKKACDGLANRKAVLENALIFGSVNKIDVPDSLPEELLSVSQQLSHGMSIIAELDQEIENKGRDIQEIENLTTHRLFDQYELRTAIGMTKQPWPEFKKPYEGKIF